jgi:hypothetical protein
VCRRRRWIALILRLPAYRLRYSHPPCEP